MRVHYFFAAMLMTALVATTAREAPAQTKAVEIDELIAKYEEFGLFNGSVLVAADGDVVYKKGIGMANMEWGVPNTPDTKFRIGSVTKQFTSALILQLVEEGKIALDAPITTYLPEYPAEQGARVTMHHLLTHTSGIPSYTGLPSMRDVERNTYAPDSFLTTFWNLDLEFEPGAEWRYNNSGYFILGAIIEKVTGESYADALRSRILNPLGLHDTGYDNYEDIIEKRATGYVRAGSGYQHPRFLHTSIPYAAGMMYSTVEDLYKWDQSLYGGGLFKKDETKALWFGPHVDMPGDDGTGYGYGWIATQKKVGEAEINVIEHGGGIYGFTTGFWRMPAERNTIIAMDNTGGSQVGSMLLGIASILYDQPVPEPKRPIADVMSRTIEEKGIEEGLRHYRELKAKSPDMYDFSESQLNMLGYSYLGKGDTETAIEIFKLNVEAYPEAFNTYDSLGEAYMEAGDDEKAISNYRKALELNPGLDNARQMLARLGVEVPELHVDVPEDILESYVGRYQLQPNFILAVTRDGRQMFVQATGQPRAEMFPSSENEFYLKVVDARLTFNRNGESEVTSLVLHQNGQNMPADRVE